MAAKAELTRAGHDRLQAELEQLETEGRKEIADVILEARGHGDLSENAEYHAAKEAQAHLETRILRLRGELTRARIVDETAIVSGRTGVGSTVEIRYTDDGSNATFQLVGSAESDLSQGRLSVESPFGSALLGRSAGDKLTVRTPGGAVKIEVVAVPPRS